jgi:hypothetical protein
MVTDVLEEAGAWNEGSEPEDWVSRLVRNVYKHLSRNKLSHPRPVYPNLFSLPYPLIRLFIYEYPLSLLPLPSLKKVFLIFLC